MARQTNGGLPVLAAAGLLAVAGCYGDPAPPPASSAGATAVSSSAGGSTVPVASSGASSLAPGCEAHWVVPSQGGSPTTLADICSAPAEPVLSNEAVHVSLAVAEGLPQLPATGTLTFADKLVDRVRGAPIIQLVAATEGHLLKAQLSGLELSAEGYSFTVTWPPGAVLLTEDKTHVSFRTAFDLGCEGGSRLVAAVSQLRLCGGGVYGSVPAAWASTGDTCVICSPPPQYTASPAIPDHQAAD